MGELEITTTGILWRKEEVLGRGASATVYLAKAKKTQTQNQNQDKSESFFPPLVAVKTAQYSKARPLLKELKILSALKGSPYILQCYDYDFSLHGEITDCSLLLEFAPGGSLSDRIERVGNGGGLPEADVQRYTRSILQGIKHIHQHGYVHCDLKPQNILICEKDVAKIADFGLSMKIHQQKHGFGPSAFVGTPLYAAPEAIYCTSFETPLDIWGLGCIVLEMISGHQPWGFSPEIDTDQILEYIARSDALPRVPVNISHEALDFLRKCLVRDVRLRWTVDMLLKHPFVATDDWKVTQVVHNSEAVTDASRTSSEISLCKPNLPSIRSSRKQNLHKKNESDNAAPLVGKKRKMLGDEVHAWEESSGSNHSTLEHQASMVQYRYWRIRRCTAREVISRDPAPLGF